MKKKEILIIVASISMLSSCATLFNSPTQRITITTSEPSKIVLQNDTSKVFSSPKYIEVNRSKQPIIISTISANSSKKINVRSRSSVAYWLNLYPSSAWLGFLIDKNNPKRYSYPQTIYIDTHINDNKYLTFIPLDTASARLNNIFKITPLKLAGLSNSSLEFSYERKTGMTFSTQIMASYLLPSNFLESNYKPKIEGYKIGIEERIYFKKSSPRGPYISFDFEYLRNQYRALEWFGVKNIYSDTTYKGTNYPDSIRIHKQTYSFNLKLGYQQIVNRFSFDFYIGIGARYKDVIHLDRINPMDEMEMPRHPNFYYITNLNGKYWTLCIPLNFKIGYLF